MKIEVIKLEKGRLTKKMRERQAYDTAQRRLVEFDEAFSTVENAIRQCVSAERAGLFDELSNRLDEMQRTLGKV